MEDLLASAINEIDELLAHFGTPSATVASRTEERQLKKLVEVIKSLQQDSSKRVVAKIANGRPAFRSYSSDGTPLRMAFRWVATLNGMRVKKNGCSSVEMLLERSFTEGVDLEGRRCAALNLREPRAMKHGKTNWHLYQAMLEFQPLLREEGHLGIAVSHYAFDRGCYQGLVRLAQKRHEKVAADSRNRALNGRVKQGSGRNRMSTFMATRSHLAPA